jgi:hypothetical protein
LRPAHSPWRGVHAKSDRCFSSFACRTHASRGLDVVFQPRSLIPACQTSSARSLSAG